MTFYDTIHPGGNASKWEIKYYKDQQTRMDAAVVSSLRELEIFHCGYQWSIDPVNHYEDRLSMDFMIKNLRSIPRRCVREMRAFHIASVRMKGGIGMVNLREFCDVIHAGFLYKNKCIWDEWVMETPKFESYVQYLPQEVLEDVMDLLIPIGCTERYSLLNQMGFKMYFDGKHGLHSDEREEEPPKKKREKDGNKISDWY